MKKLMLIALTMLSLGSTAMADTVTINSQASFSTPAGTISSKNDFAFVGTQTITFTVAGKTCNLNGSARGSVPMGCNYSIFVAPNGSISGSLAAGNAVCTQSDQIASSCK